jgi:hypothetical protein
MYLLLVLEGEAEDYRRARPLLGDGKRLQRHFRSGVSQIGGFLVEGNLIAPGVILVDPAYRQVGVYVGRIADVDQESVTRRLLEGQFRWPGAFEDAIDLRRSTLKAFF